MHSLPWVLEIIFTSKQQCCEIWRQFQFGNFLQQPFSLIKWISINNRINYEKCVSPSYDIIVCAAILYLAKIIKVKEFKSISRCWLSEEKVLRKKINYTACVQNLNLDRNMILFEIYIVLVEKIYGKKWESMRLKLKVKSMSILMAWVMIKNDPLKLPFAELYSPINRFVRYRTVMAVNG